MRRKLESEADYGMGVGVITKLYFAVLRHLRNQ